MGPRKKNASIKSTGATSSKAEPLPDWVKNKTLAKPPPKYTQQQQGSKGQQEVGGSKDGGKTDARSLAGSEGSALRPPPLFPPGTKTPINLLNERIQKHFAPKGWLRPSIDSRKLPRGGGEDDGAEERWTFVVTMTKTNKADQGNPYVVRMDARDQSGCEDSRVSLSSKEEAKHWGATYALFRICSNLSFEQVLPTGPREYWKQLSSAKAKAPEHLNWLWASDPFEAVQKMQAEKEATRIAREKREQDLLENGPRLPRAWLEAREARLSKELRDTVESTVREALQVYPIDPTDEASQSNATSPTASGTATPRDVQDYAELQERLIKLGFRPGHARSATRWLADVRRGDSAKIDSVSASLKSITQMADEDACLEYLSIFCPEDDLPSRFAPTRKAESFVTVANSANDNTALAERWIVDRIVRLAGFPRPATETALHTLSQLDMDVKESACIDLLLRQLSRNAASASSQVSDQQREPVRIDVDAQRQARDDERMALEAVLGEERILEIPSTERPLVDPKVVPHKDLFDIVIAKAPQEEDIRLRICTGAHTSYPSPSKSSLPTFFVASTTLPAYIRLALTRKMTRCLLGMDRGHDDWQEMLLAGQGGVLLAMVEELETCWRDLTHNPPDLAEVMGGLARQRSKQSKPALMIEDRRATQDRHHVKKRIQAKALVNNTTQNEILKARYAELQQSSEFAPIRAARMRLPAAANAEEIVALLRTNRLLIIAGETGCGKTTQCPQFVLDDMLARGQGSICNIIVTQPRRLSAMGVAARVAHERCETLDGRGMVGYAIRGESRSGKSTNLLFTTTGVLLRRLSTNDPDLRGVSHVFVDEVHERGVDSDLLLLELREVLRRNKTLRVILMSATIERETFTNYFPDTPTLDIPGRTFAVTDYYLEDVREMLGQDVDQDEIENRQERRSTGNRESIEYVMLAQTVEMICKRAGENSADDGGILVFLPGVAEIRRAMESITQALGNAVEVLPLHANLSPDEQRRVFGKVHGKRRKVICATNVAETSITIDDIVYVIDCGLVKETRYDAQTGLTKLVEVRCSQANARQRRGRAGRVRPGQCFRMYTRATEQHRMAAQQEPEMKRMSLENLILSVKALKGDSVAVDTYLGSAISPPSLEAIRKAMEILSEMNVLVDGERLTALGKHLSLLPLDVRLAKLLVYGCVFHCLAPALTIAAVLSSKPMFNAPFEQREQASQARLKFLTGRSDIMTDAAAFQRWTQMRSNGEGNARVRQWCEEHFISVSALRDVASVRSELLGNLIEMGFVSSTYKKSGQGQPQSLDDNAEDVQLQRALLAGALYPSVVRIVHPQAKYDKAIGGTIEREAEARQVRYFDARSQRVFLHPSSVLFSTGKFATDFLVSFRRGATPQQQRQQQQKSTGDKIFLRDATEVSTFALLLFGGRLRMHRREGGISMGGDDGGGTEPEGWIKVRANGRIAALVNQLRFLLDAAMAKSFDDPTVDVFASGIESEVRDCLCHVLRHEAW